jgi:hypothetical protein
MHGHGVCEYANGDRFEGSRRAGSLVYGTLSFATDLSTFTGNFEGRVPHGEGVMRMANGKVVTGEWSHGVQIKKDSILAKFWWW